MRQAVLGLLNLAQDKQCLLDSLPVPVVQVHLAPQVGADGKEHGATFGKVPSMKLTIFGYKLHLPLAVNGTILDFELAPANETDLKVGAEQPSSRSHLQVIGDKAYLNQAVQEQCAKRTVALLTLPGSNQKEQVSQASARRFNRLRQKIETVHGQLTQQLKVEINHSHTLRGLVYAFVYQADSAYAVHLNQSFARQDKVLSNRGAGLSPTSTMPHW